MGYRITFKNTLSKPVLLEIRVGSNADCDANQQVYDDSVNSNDSKGIDTDQPAVCYRRTQDPDNPGTMTSWGTFSPDDTNTPATLDLGLLI